MSIIVTANQKICYIEGIWIISLYPGTAFIYMTPDKDAYVYFNNNNT